MLHAIPSSDLHISLHLSSLSGHPSSSWSSFTSWDFVSNLYLHHSKFRVRFQEAMTSFATTSTSSKGYSAWLRSSWPALRRSLQIVSRAGAKISAMWDEFVESHAKALEVASNYGHLERTSSTRSPWNFGRQRSETRWRKDRPS